MKESRIDIALQLNLPGRGLDEDELTELVRRVAEDADLWRPFVHHIPEERHCASLHADDDVGIWVISWLPGHDTGLHDHSGSSGAVVVVEGEVLEERPASAAAERLAQVGRDEGFTFDGADVHRVVAVGDEPAVTIHAYSPPLHEMGVYTIDEDGLVVRTVIGWNRVLTA